ncbi:hypothetical protein BU16DRAFT_524145 [Lophium mytilinum]|uniref:BTB domain-containing protein n=1 Tax=Lophium mytilinum TaxID=390894 RepID=A0A6A6R4K6_9PEZI|nr:hypothetical protein BU16DRAFT_524145 [Lophium mytilinum]
MVTAKKASASKVVKNNVKSCSDVTRDRVRSSLPRMFGTEMVTLRIGPQAEPFYVHKNLLTHWSPYFRGAFDGSFVEAETKSIALEDVQPWLFKIVMGWLYTQTLVLDKAAEELSDLKLAETSPFDQTLEEDVDPNRYAYVCLKRVHNIAQRNEFCDIIPKIREEMISLAKLEVRQTYNLEFLQQEMESLATMKHVPFSIIHGLKAMPTIFDIATAGADMLPGPIGPYIRGRAKEIYRRWYRVVNTRHGDDRDDTDSQQFSYNTLVDMYIFADKYDMPQLRRDIIDKVHFKNSHYPDSVPYLYAVLKAFESLPKTSGLSRYFFDVYVGDWNGQAILGGSGVKIGHLLPNDLLSSIATRRSKELFLLPGTVLSPMPYETSLCSYHEHPPNDEPNPTATVVSS